MKECVKEWILVSDTSNGKTINDSTHIRALVATAKKIVTLLVLLKGFSDSGRGHVSLEQFPAF